VRIAEAVHAEVMTSEGEVLTHAEFASLLLVGHLRSAFDPPAEIPAEHSARLIALGYMIELAGSLRMTTQGRIRIYAGQLAS
jgi:hypothetical protein